jgi:hypothetical protein
MAVGRDLVDSFDRAVKSGKPEVAAAAQPTIRPAHPSIRMRGLADRRFEGDGCSDRQNDQHGAPGAVIADAPPSPEDAVTVFPQYLVAAVRIAFTGRPGHCAVT